MYKLIKEMTILRGFLVHGQVVSFPDLKMGLVNYHVPFSSKYARMLVHCSFLI